MSGVTVIHGPKKGLKKEEIADIVLKEFLFPGFTTKQGLQDYVRAHLAKTFYDVVDFTSKAYGLMAENKENHLYDYYVEHKDPAVIKTDLMSAIAHGLKGWDNPYNDVNNEEYKKNDSIILEHTRRTLEGEEPILSHFLYVTEGTLPVFIHEPYFVLFDEEMKINKAERERLVHDYGGLHSIDFFSGLSFLPLRKDVPAEKYMEVYEKLTGEKSPFPESISAYCFCTGLLKNYGLGDEKHKPLKFNR
jgi:hypothetical protein